MQYVKTAKTACAIVVLGAMAGWAGAQGTPSADQMIEQLKKPATRSLRNLGVEPVNAPGAASPAANSGAANTSAAPAAPANVAVAPASTNAVAPTVPVAPTNPEPAARPSLSLLIQFDFDSTRVKPESQQALANLAVALKSPELSASRFAVEGHTDAKGRADYNLRLSQQRADAVRQLLTQQGVNAQRLQAAGKGATELANAAEPGAAENRRVRIVNLD